MQITLWILAVLVTLSATSYRRTKLSTATFCVFLLMIGGTTLNIVGTVSWIVFLVAAIPLNITSIRRKFISAPILNVFNKIMPEISQTEQEALDAGTVWLDGELFSGKPNWKTLHDVPVAKLTNEEQAFLDGPVEEACKMVDEWEIHHKLADLPPTLWNFIKENKFFAMIIKKQYGGLEFSAYAQSRVLQKLSGRNSVLTTTVGVPNSLGPGELLQHYGTEEQKDYYLPRLAKGEEVPCFALTGPEAGSDAGSIPDKGIICKGQWQGKEVIGMSLTFDKRYITLAPVATVVGLAFKLFDPDGLIGNKKELGITCALLPRETEGMDIGRRHLALNVPFQNGPVRGENIFVPLDMIIGGPNMAGQGWRMLVECLSVGRCITLPSNSAGGAKTVALATGAYARIRRQFKLPIGKMEGIEEMLGRIGGNAYLMDAVTSLTTKSLDLGEKPSVISAICKYHLTEKMRTIVNDAMDVHGGKGIMMGPNNLLARSYQGLPIAITVEGANILTRNMMIYGQGAIRCHPFVLKEMYAAADKDKARGLIDFDSALFGHVGLVSSNLVASVWNSLTANKFAPAPFKDETARYYRAMSRFSANMLVLSDISMALLGGELKRKERLSARLGDILSYLYLGMAVLKRFDDQGRQKEDLPFMHWAMQDCLFKVEVAIDDCLDNFPSKPIALILRSLLAPFGKKFKKPSDKLEHQIAKILQSPCAARSRLGEGQYLTRDLSNPYGDLEQTLADIVQSEQLHQKVCAAIGETLPFVNLDKVAEKGRELGLLSDSEIETLIRAEQGRLNTINVDDFDHSELAIDSSHILKTEKAA